ncbi:hypothetical protein RINTU1_10800 [Candidatus Regiella insecticola]|uniref:Uncharacterized protein n=1 Tax=Candidatus Regiella insecticola TaxID=138073 RepID=A0A6L2ZNE6_9ENTR|nr:hypothetical protein RINTU1_10800 [Candidatus Regiella insecticola]
MGPKKVIFHVVALQTEDAHAGTANENNNKIGNSFKNVVIFFIGLFPVSLI